METGNQTFGNQSTSSNMRRSKRKSEEIARNFNTTLNITQSLHAYPTHLLLTKRHEHMAQSKYCCDHNTL